MEEKDLQTTTKPETDGNQAKDGSKLKSAASVIAAIAGFFLAGLAVAALAVTLLLTFVNSNNKVDEAVLKSFKSEKQISAKLKNIIKDNSPLYVSDAKYLKSNAETALAADGGAPKSTVSRNNNSTYTQYSSVDEADTVKTDGRYIYYLDNYRSGKITVFSAKGKDSKKVSEINISGKSSKSDSNYYVKDFYVTDNKLIALEQSWGGFYNYYRSSAYTRVEIFDISDIKNIKSTFTFNQSGSCCSSRMIDGVLYVASTHYASGEKDFPCAAFGDTAISTDDEANPDRLPPDCIYYVEKPNEPNFLVLSSIDTKNPSENTTNTKSVLGSANEVYCNENYMYITACEYNYDIYSKENSDGASYTHLPVNTTQIVKVDLRNDLTFTASAKVSGYVDNQYSFDEKDGYLRVATTVTLDNKNFTESASLFVLDSSLKCVGKVTDFAKDESIKAVRYIGDIAYVITYKETDPLFIIDLKDVRSPKILGEVKISGFSTMLVPVDDSTLLGIGYYTADEDDGIDMEIQEGVKLVTFDISDKSSPKVKDQKVFKNYSSPVQYNPKALLYNKERGDYTIPMNYGYYNDEDDTFDTKSGILNFKVENGKIVIVDDYTSKTFVSTDDISKDLDRCVYTGDYIYLLGAEYNYYSSDCSAVIEAVKYK